MLSLMMKLFDLYEFIKVKIAIMDLSKFAPSDETNRQAYKDSLGNSE